MIKDKIFTPFQRFVNTECMGGFIMALFIAALHLELRLS